jgi:hypothetical protein
VNVSPRLRYHLIGWVLWPAGVAVLAVPCFILSPWFFVLVMAWTLYLNALQHRIRCPSCGERIGWGDHTILGLRFKGWRNILPRLCDHCGNDLSVSGDTRGAAKPGGAT